MQIVQANFFQSEIISYHDTNQHFGIEMYTINKVKGLLFFLVAIKVLTFTFLTVHRERFF